MKECEGQAKDQSVGQLSIRCARAGNTLSLGLREEARSEGRWMIAGFVHWACHPME